MVPRAPAEEGRDDEEARACAEAVLYPLWDLKLEVGHAVRSAEEAVGMAREDLTAATALLDLRFLDGDRRLFENLEREVRAIERAMIPEYEQAVDQLIKGLTAANHADAVAIAGLPDQVRGYEHLKLGRATTYRTELAARLQTFTQSAPR